MLLERSWRFAEEYLPLGQYFIGTQFSKIYTAICDTSTKIQRDDHPYLEQNLLIKMLLTMFGPSPFVKAPSPSSLPILIKPARALGYRYLCWVSFTPSEHMRTRTTFEYQLWLDS